MQIWQGVEKGRLPFTCSITRFVTERYTIGTDGQATSCKMATHLIYQVTTITCQCMLCQTRILYRTKCKAWHVHLIKNRHYAHDKHAYPVLVYTCYSIPESGRKVSQDKMCVVDIETELSMTQNVGLFRTSSTKKSTYHLIILHSSTQTILHQTC